MDEPRTVSKATFGCLTFTLTLVIAVVANLAAHAAGRTWGFRVEPGWMAGLTILYMVLARVAADAILRRFGLSRSGTVVEVRSRSPYASDEDDPPGDFAEAHLSGGTKTFLRVGLPLMGLFLLAIPLLLGERAGLMRWLSQAMGLFFLGCFVHLLWDGKNPQARVDAEGITGYPSHRAMRRVFVPWSDVLTCEIRTIYNTFGEPVVLLPILRGHDGETLMELNLMQTPMAEQDRVVKFIKSRLPKPQVDPWEV